MKKIITLLTVASAFIGTNLSAQSWQWAKGEGGSANDYGSSVVIDGSGNSYVTGGFSSSTITFGSTTLTNHGGIDFYLVKYDASGNVLWANGATGASNDGGYNVNVDASGNVYVVGSSNSATLTFGTTALTLHGYDDVFLVKYDASGNVLWAKGPGGSGNDIGESISVDPSGNVYITGYYTSATMVIGTTTLTNTSGAASSSGTNDFFIAKYDASGNPLWAKTAGGTANEAGLGIATDASGNAYVTGNYASSSITFGTTSFTNGGGIDYFIVKYNSAGTVVWGKSATGASNDVGYNIRVDANKNPIVVGTFNSSTLTFGTTALSNSGYDDIFVVKYDSLGNVLWGKKAGGSGNDIGASISVDGSGNSCITGYFSSPSMAFGTTTLTNAGGAAGSGGTNDIYLAQYDASGNVLGAKSVSASGDDRGNAVAVDGTGSVVITGYSASTTITFGTFALTNAGGNDIYTAKLTGITAGIDQVKNAAEMVSVYPNPNNGVFELEIKDIQSNVKTEITIIDMLGREVYSASSNLQNSGIKIDLSNQSTGMYYIVVSNNGKQYRGKVTISK